mgnify:CR=1 FL=1
MVAIWLVKGDLKDKSSTKVEKRQGVVVTKGPSCLPDFQKIGADDNQEILAIRSISLLLEFEKDNCDFAVDQTK